MSISEKIQQLRKSNGLSQEQLAEKLNVSRQAISKWESGTSLPDAEKIVLISDLFEVSTDYLMKDENTSRADDNNQQIIQVSRKLYISDINKRKLSAFDEFEIEIINSDNKGEGTLITGISKPNAKVRVPVCALYGITKGILGINQQTLLGFYASLEEAKKELDSISKTSEKDTVYELKYAAKMQGVRIADSD
ncbi:MAG: helix-turn-helix domain-containing protein [Oscillospiraceae bacterium]|nr:helix-turn-helix domain-containing protein [Oscillospiraceae bacterium]